MYAIESFHDHVMLLTFLPKEQTTSCSKIMMKGVNWTVLLLTVVADNNC